MGSLYGLHVVCHGGECCAIKTIKGFDWFNKSSPQPPLDEIKDNNRDSRGDTVSSGERFFTGYAPKEPCTDRLDRYIKFIQARRPQGAIEVVLAAGQITVWHQELLDRGFKVTVPEFRNSNSGNLCQIYHLVYDFGPVTHDDDDDDYDDDYDEDEDFDPFDCDEEED